MKSILFIGPLLFVTLLIGLNVAFSGNMIGNGERLHTLEKNVHALQLQQKELASTLASSQSLQRVYDEALAQGYVPISQVAYLDTTRTVASR
ncbi:MAG TPA: hypothetical protein DCX25_01525 [Candidatus Pacebacteria bacterium]|nr:MAG: hypothetical protein UX00_C0009G0022 [Microgenomates group bacterium GW2011_GWB1_45_17]KKU23272.1 MAG: hypothetical protein UX35_C0007G0010 [Microgenomates group bacterium GW2011_GWA1_46_15]KKU23441.1 MAG: hypothetical protein UX36_C0005G0022 [Microgenomates group bacterium GW2011_GWC1_46_15]HAV14985.1 hypothetical protein [Candidatus Paceibacterota bacterium]HCR11598.1 hypothetical protein [Candidatus Paceibacterota bacterium]